MTPRQLGRLREADPENYAFLEEALKERNRRLFERIKPKKPKLR